MGELNFATPVGENSDGKLKPLEIFDLPNLNYSSGSIINIYACHSASGEYSVAQAFADGQRVESNGVDGDSSFSGSYNYYQEISKNTVDIYLGGYDKGRNTNLFNHVFGSQGRLDNDTFLPGGE